VASEEPFLVHILAVLRLYAVLFHLLPQNDEILAIQNLRVSLTPRKVNGVKVSAIQDVLVSIFKACRPVFAGLLATYMIGLQSHYCWCRWQTSVTELLYFIDKYHFLLVGQQLFCLVSLSYRDCLSIEVLAKH
jgi:hypothetical protein